MGPRMIKRLQMLQIGQVVRNEGPESHFSKRGTPTMGGVMILAAITITVLLWADLTNPYVWAVLAVLLGYGAVGLSMITVKWCAKYRWLDRALEILLAICDCFSGCVCSVCARPRYGGNAVGGPFL